MTSTINSKQGLKGFQPVKDKKIHKKSVFLTDQELKQLEKLANKKGLSIADYIRLKILAEDKKALT